MFNKYFKAKRKELIKIERKEFLKKEISFLDNLKSNEDNYYNLFNINNIKYYIDINSLYSNQFFSAPIIIPQEYQRAENSDNSLELLAQTQQAMNQMYSDTITQRQNAAAQQMNYFTTGNTIQQRRGAQWDPHQIQNQIQPRFDTTEHVANWTSNVDGTWTINGSGDNND